MTLPKVLPSDRDWIDEASVAMLARAAGYSFRPEELPEITAQLRRAHEIAAPLLAYEPDDVDEFGPVWKP